MTVLAAVALGGLFSGCSNDVDLSGGMTSAEYNIIQNYENAFITRFGQPDSTQTWGFGDDEASTRGLATVPSPYVEPSVKTYNAQMCLSWQGVMAAEDTGTDWTKFYDMGSYVAWKDKGWNDQFYDVHGHVVSSTSTISDETIAALTNVIVGTQEKPGLIREGRNNLDVATSTGYSIVTTGGPVTLSPIYHYSNSGDRLSYYYYPKGKKPTAEEIKTMKKYSLGNMSDPQHNGDKHFYRYTYSLVYEKPDGTCQYEFPPGYEINFVISNTWNDYAGYKDKIYKEGGITSMVGGSEATQTVVDKYAITEGQNIQCGDAVNAPNNKIRIQFSKPNPSTTTTTTTAAPQFAAPQEGSYIWSRSTYTRYTAGNGVNGTLTDGSTCYYFKANETGLLNVAVLMNGGTLKVCEIGNDWDGTGSTPVDFEIQGSNNNNGFVCAFHVTQGKVYAVYAENGVLGYYGYTYLDYNGSSVIEDKPLDQYSGGPYNCGSVFDNSMGFNKIHVKLGKGSTVTTTTTTPGEPIYFNTATKGDGNHPIEGYPALTSGTTATNPNGGYNPGSTIYFIRPTEAGILRTAVKLSANKKFHVEDLGDGEGAWNKTSGRTLISEIKDASNSYYGTYDINAEANHVYAVYAEGSKLGFFGCELIHETPGVAGTPSTSEVVWKEIPRTPDYYSDGNMNTEIHSTDYGYGVGNEVGGVKMPEVPITTSHTAVFKGTVNDTEYTFVGFEDWIDFDYNDLVFAVTGTKPVIEKPEIEIPEPEDPGPGSEEDGFVCRIIAEDLTVGEGSDFDFNDVVFDVYRDGNLIIRAIGGELPLYIGMGSRENATEVHQACKITLPDNFNNNHGLNSHMVMRNTGWASSGNSKVYEEIDWNADLGHIKVDGTFNSRSDAKKIKLWVKKSSGYIELFADKGKVASKVCVGRDYKWCSERQDIDNKFRDKNGVKLFQQYVIGKLGDRWDQQTAWYQYKDKVAVLKE